jgi:hypothetical protein
MGGIQLLRIAVYHTDAPSHPQTVTRSAPNLRHRAGIATPEITEISRAVMAHDNTARLQRSTTVRRERSVNSKEKRYLEFGLSPPNQSAYRGSTTQEIWPLFTAALRLRRQPK